MEKPEGFDRLAEKLYPDKQLREANALGDRLIVVTEKLSNAELEYQDSLKKLNEYVETHDGNFPGSFLKWENEMILSNLNDLMNFTFGG